MTTPYILVPLWAALMSIGVALYVWRYHALAHTRWFVVMALGNVLWALGYALQIRSSTLIDKVFWADIKHMGSVIMPLAWFAFALSFAGRRQWLRGRYLALLFIEPVVTLAVMWTNDQHELVRVDPHLDDSHVFTALVFDYGIWSWLHLSYCAAMIVAGLYWVLQYTPRRQVGLIMLGVAIPFLAQLLVSTGAPLPLDMTPLAAAGGLVLLAVAIYAFQTTTILPIARASILQQMHDGVIVLNTDYCVIDLNPAAQHITGVASADAIGQPAEALLPGYDPQAPPTELALGTKLPRYYSLRVVPLGGDQPIGWLITLSDITERKETAAQLKQRIEQLAMLQRVDSESTRRLDVDYVLNMTLDLIMRFAGANCGFIALADDEENLTMAHEIGGYPPQVPYQDAAIVGRVTASRRGEWVLDVSAGPNQTVIPHMQAQIALPLLSQDRLVGVVCVEASSRVRFTLGVYEFLNLVVPRIAIALDNARLYQAAQRHLAEMQALNEQLSQLEQLKTDMIRIAAHDLRNPIHTLSGYLELLEEDLGEARTPPIQAYLDAMNRVVERMAQITADILSLQRIEQSASGDLTETLDLGLVVQSVFNDHRPAAKAKDLVYVRHLPSAPLMVKGDAGQLREAVANLISNAIKYTPPGNNVEVVLQKVDAQARLEVRDTGFGIPAELQDKLFQPFYRAKTQETASIDGTGLGLHLVKNMIERHGGTLHFHSTHGQGSVFGFVLPLVK